MASQKSVIPRPFRAAKKRFVKFSDSLLYRINSLMLG